MAFVKLTTAKIVQAGVIKGSFSISKKGKGTFFVSVPSALAGKTWDDVERVDISVGDGAEAGLLQINACDAGAFKIGRMKSALVLRVPQQPQWLCAAFDPVQLDTVGDHSASSFVLRLPKALFEAPTYAQAEKPRSAGVAVQVARQGDRPKLSIIGTTVEHGQKRAKLTMPLFKMFSALWKAWGEPVRATALQVAMGDDDHDITKLLVALNRDLEALRLTVEAVQGGYKLLLVD
jgi:hypothetical protein